MKNFYRLLIICFVLCTTSVTHAQLITVGTSITNTNAFDMFGPYSENFSSHKVQYMYLGSELAAAGAPATVFGADSYTFSGNLYYYNGGATLQSKVTEAITNQCSQCNIQATI